MTTPSQNQPGSSTSPGSTSGATGTDSGQPGAGAQRLADEAKAQSRAEIDRARESTAHKAETLAESARAAAAALERDDIGHLSQYVSDMADGMTRFADGLRHKSGDEIARDVGRIARENPALFIAGSVAIGFGLSRFARASSRHGPHAMVPADEARTGLDSVGGRTPQGDDTVYSAGVLHDGPADTDSRDKGGMH